MLIGAIYIIEQQHLNNKGFVNKISNCLKQSCVTLDEIQLKVFKKPEST